MEKSQPRDSRNLFDPDHDPERGYVGRARRMPVILDDAANDLRVDPGMKDVDAADLLKPCDAECSALAEPVETQSQLF